MPEPKHVLVVEPDDDVRGTLVGVIESLGHRSSAAHSGEAMRTILEKPDAVDLIVLDVDMAGEANASLASHAKRLGIRVVMISGHPGSFKVFADRADQLLHKPFGIQQVKDAIGDALHSEVFGQRGEDAPPG
jgi:DNA-binding NtrC family response regulator